MAVVVVASDWQLDSGHYEEFVVWPVVAYASQDAADTTKYVIYPRPDSEVDANARHRWAHASMDYEIPICVRAGAFPYHMEVEATTHSSVKSAITIGANHDSANSYVITIPAATIDGLADDATEYGIEIKITDQAGKIMRCWFSFKKEITPLSHFIFVDSSYSGGSNDGSFALPFTDLIDTDSGATNVFSGDGTNGVDLIAVIKEGNSQTTPYTKDGNWGLSSTARPFAYINDPADTNRPKIDLQASNVLFQINGSGYHNDGFLRGLVVLNGMNPAAQEGRGAFVTTFDQDYERLTLSYIKFDTVASWSGSSSSTNNGCITIAWTGADRIHIALVDIEMANITESGHTTNTGTGLMFMGGKYVLVDNWTFSDFMPGTGDVPHIIHFKHNWQDTTCRRIAAIDNVRSTAILVSDEASGNYDGSNIEVCYNNLKRTDGSDQSIRLVQSGASPDKLGPGYAYRNTLNGGRQFSNWDVTTTWKGNVSTTANGFSGDSDNTVIQPNYDDAVTGDFEATNVLKDAWYTTESETRGTVGHEIA